MIKVSEWGIKMDYTVPENFYEFKCGWYRGIDLDYEAEQLLKVPDAAQKENDIQHYIKENKKWFIPASILKNMTLVIMRHISAWSSRLEQNTGQVICCSDGIQ